MFVNHGWPPHQYNDLPEREKILLSEFILKSARDREAERQKLKG